MKLARPSAGTAALLITWIVLTWVALTSRPLLPLDETRYLSVAWDMWTHGNELVPHLNGQIYSQKPPLLFWLIQAGWSVFGVSEFWGRMVAPLFGLGALFAARSLGARLWPDEPERAALLPWLLLGSLLWTVFATVTMFDMGNVLFAVVGAIGIVLAWQGRALFGWALVAFSIGLGVLNKGPVILVYVLPMALAAPWWGRPALGAPLWRWYMGLAAGVAGGAAIALSWAMPAASAGGPAYANAILWGQTAGRVAESFAHREPFWFYVPLVPVLLLPWAVWPAAWRGTAAALRSQTVPVRFALSWLVPGFIVLSAFSGKQPHYLLPLFPAFAILVAAGMPVGQMPRWSRVVPGAVTVAIGFALAFVSMWVRYGTGATTLRLPEYAQNIGPVLGLAIVVIGVVAAIVPLKANVGAVAVLSVHTVLVVLALHVFGVRPLNYALNIAPIAFQVREFQREGRPMAVLDEYQGQFNFLGRITTPLPVYGWEQAYGFLHSNVRTLLLTFVAERPPRWMGAQYVYPYRGGYVAIFNDNAWDVYRTESQREQRRVTAGPTANRSVLAPGANAVPAAPPH